MMQWKMPVLGLIFLHTSMSVPLHQPVTAAAAHHVKPVNRAHDFCRILQAADEIQ